MRPPRPVRIKKPGVKPGKAAARAPRDLETPIQIAIVEYLRAVLWPGSIIHHSPNEIGVALDTDHRIRVISGWKRLGMLPGFADLVIFARQPAAATVTALIEVKAETD